MENNQQEFSMEAYNDLITKIKCGSPVHKINLSIENNNAVAGMYLITMPDVKTYLTEKNDLENLNNDTLLVFESRHVVECSLIIYGCLYLLHNANAIQFSIKYIIDRYIKILLSRPKFYDEIIREIGMLARSSIRRDGSKNSKKIHDDLEYIMKNIIFVPYAKIDEIGEEAIKEFKEKYDGDDKNE